MTTKDAHNQTRNRVKDALLLFAIPVGIITLLVAFIYIPRLLANPSYDFIYCEGYRCDSQFSVDTDGNIQSTTSENNRRYLNDADLLYYDVSNDASRPLEIDEAKRYHLNTSSRAPDGYTLEYDSGNSGFLFLGGSQRSWSLNKGLANKPVRSSSPYGDSKFIGWVLP